MTQPIKWITDPHLIHLRDRERWFEDIAEHDGSFFITGDFGCGESVTSLLKTISKAAKHSVIAVLGNHDFYGSSIELVREKLKKAGFADTGSNLLVFEPTLYSAPIRLDDSTWVVGTGGAGDARAGIGDPSVMKLNDENYIWELARARANGSLGKFLQDLGTEHAEFLKWQLEAIPKTAKTVIILSHVPPFHEAAWHADGPSDDYALPRFCWQAGGETIREWAGLHPEVAIKVFCGHTHTGGDYESENITCHTGGSQYRTPHYNGYIHLGTEEQPHVVFSRRDGFIMDNGCLKFNPEGYKPFGDFQFSPP